MLEPHGAIVKYEGYDSYELPKDMIHVLMIQHIRNDIYYFFSAWNETNNPRI